MLIQELQRRGHEVTLFANPQSQPGCKLTGYRESNPYNWIDMVRINRLTSRIANQGFDLVHTFGRMSNIAFLMLRRIKKVVSYQLPPTLTQVQKAVKAARTNSLYFTACSNYIARQIDPYCDVTTIYNGVDLVNYEFNAQAGPDAPLVFLGRIEYEKGTAIAIETAKRAGRKLIIAGNVTPGEIHQQYFAEQVQPHIDQHQIKYIGPVDDSQKNTLLRGAAAMLMPVMWHEPFGIVMAEALACGTPVIGFNKGAVPEVVTNGVNGFVCSTEDEMVEAVQNIGTISRQACRRTAEEKFSSDVLGQQYEELYQRILK